MPAHGCPVQSGRPFHGFVAWWVSPSWATPPLFIPRVAGAILTGFAIVVGACHSSNTRGYLRLSQCRHAALLRVRPCAGLDPLRDLTKWSCGFVAGQSLAAVRIGADFRFEVITGWLHSAPHHDMSVATGTACHHHAVRHRRPLNVCQRSRRVDNAKPSRRSSLLLHGISSPPSARRQRIILVKPVVGASGSLVVHDFVVVFKFDQHPLFHLRPPSAPGQGAGVVPQIEPRPVFCTTPASVADVARQLLPASSAMPCRSAAVHAHSRTAAFDAHLVAWAYSAPIEDDPPCCFLGIRLFQLQRAGGAGGEVGFGQCAPPRFPLVALGLERKDTRKVFIVLTFSSNCAPLPPPARDTFFTASANLSSS